jgi:uncharacterized membrane protein
VETFLTALHVLAAVLLIGPLVLAPFAGRRAIARRSPDGIRGATRQMAAFGAGSVVVAGLGVLALFASHEYDFGTPWVTISMTLYVIAVGLVYLYAIPALRRAARMVDEGVPAAPEPGERNQEPETTLTVTGTDVHAKERLEAISARLAGAGLLVLLVFAAITLLMSVRPFGS